MANKVTLIIPDLHLRWQDAEHITSTVKHDEVIFLGDYFDDFNDTPEMVSEMCEWLEASSNKPNRIHLFGNHDVHYAFTYRVLKCAGYEDWKYFLIHDTLPREVWDKMKWFHILDGKWLLTHAGLHKANLPVSVAKLQEDRPVFMKAVEEFLTAETVNAFRMAANNRPYWFWNAGQSRGGKLPFGGITWCDFEREFVPVQGLNQVLGHTPQGNGLAKWCIGNPAGKYEFRRTDLYTPVEAINDVKYSVNLNLDVYRNTHYALWDGKNMSVHKCGTLDV